MGIIKISKRRLHSKYQSILLPFCPEHAPNLTTTSRASSSNCHQEVRSSYTTRNLAHSATVTLERTQSWIKSFHKKIINCRCYRFVSKKITKRSKRHLNQTRLSLPVLRTSNSLPSATVSSPSACTAPRTSQNTAHQRPKTWLRGCLRPCIFMRRRIKTIIQNNKKTATCLR